MRKIITFLILVLITLLLVGCMYRFRYTPPKQNNTVPQPPPPPPPPATNTTPPRQCTAEWSCNGSYRQYVNSDCSVSDMTLCANGCSAGTCTAPTETNQTTEPEPPQNQSQNCTGVSCGGAIIQQHCSDSDNGRNYTLKGMITITRNDTAAAIESAVDMCLNETFLKEYYCSADESIASEEMLCSLRCLEGACTVPQTCDAGWFCDGATRYYSYASCERTYETVCTEGCLAGSCLMADNGGGGGGGDNEPPVNDTQPPANDTEPPPEEPPPGGPQDNIE